MPAKRKKSIGRRTRIAIRKRLERIAKDFYKMWKKNRAKAYLVFGKRAIINARGREISMSEMGKG